MTMQMVGKTCGFGRGWLKVRFTFDSPSQDSFVVEEGGVIPNGHAETVALPTSASSSAIGSGASLCLPMMSSGQVMVLLGIA
ncbi:hypothetical protein [Streptosporangium sp. NPDC002721]|uniref:hypothetical protein n=1 Tax=Streptosporangium sp. NPDC002721 TaxID=3366188 RepID=UPI0036C51A66